MNNTITINYTDEFEILLKQEAEKAEAMSVLHHLSYQQYNMYSVFVNIPVIILSSVVGFLSPINLFENQNIFLGSISLIVAILKTLDSYFNFTTRSENHRLTSLNYFKLFKFIQIQLSLEKQYRIVASDLLSIITNDLDNLKTSEPIINYNIINLFNKKYKNEDTTKPNITNGLTKIIINKKEIINKEIINKENEFKSIEIKKPFK